jgi:hypothetical protein
MTIVAVGYEEFQRLLKDTNLKFTLVFRYVRLRCLNCRQLCFHCKVTQQDCTDDKAFMFKIYRSSDKLFYKGSGILEAYVHLACLKDGLISEHSCPKNPEVIN